MCLKPSLLWEQEMYKPFQYNRVTNNFHWFISDVRKIVIIDQNEILLISLSKQDCNTGLNFAKEEEAQKFYDVVMSKIDLKTQKHDSKTATSKDRTSNMIELNTNKQPVVFRKPTVTAVTTAMSEPSKIAAVSKLNQIPIRAKSPSQASASSISPPRGSFFASLFANKRMKKFSRKWGKKKVVVEKSEIGEPTAFRVVQHIGVSNTDTNKYDVRNFLFAICL